MASTWSQNYFLTQRLSLALPLSLVLTLTRIFYVAGSAAELRGEVGGNVTFRCPVDHQRPIEFLYLQKDKEFVNGYYASKDDELNTWTNTKFDLEDSAVFMYSLNLSHSGVYSCHIRYKGSSNIVDTTIILIVTAKYSIPSFTSPVCNENVELCHVTCRSYSGYPKAQMVFWTVVGNTSSLMWENVTSKEVHNSSTMLYDSFSTANYNCSSGEIKFRCSVGNVTSNEFSVCTHQNQHNTLVIAAAICVVAVVIVIVVVLCSRRWAGNNVRPVRVPPNDEMEIAAIKEAA